MSSREVCAPRPTITTTDQPLPLITTTTTIAGNSSRGITDSRPTVASREASQHAHSFGFDWNKRADRHRYQLTTGLPEIHAAILNQDWDHVRDILAPEDLGLCWLAPFSQRPPSVAQATPHASRWSSQLLSTDANKQHRAIIEMAIDICGTTMTDHRCLHGANLLTLCLLTKAPVDVVDKVLALAATHAPQYLHIPDAAGRTPLAAAVSSGVAACVVKLMHAGAHPLAPVAHAQGVPPSCTLALAADEADLSIYMMLLSAVPYLRDTSGRYAYDRDPACFARWLSRHDVADATLLADRYPILKGPLLCFIDKSGTSRLCRMIRDGTLEAQMPPGLRSQLAWYAKHDVSLQPMEGMRDWPLLAAAEHGSIRPFISMLAYWLPDGMDIDSDDDERPLSVSMSASASAPASATFNLRSRARRHALSDDEYTREYEARFEADYNDDVYGDSDVEVASDTDIEPSGKVNLHDSRQKELIIAALKVFVEHRSTEDLKQLVNILPSFKPWLGEAPY